MILVQYQKTPSMEVLLQPMTGLRSRRAECCSAPNSRKASPKYFLRFERSVPNVPRVVYIGETASLSYLQFLRRVVKHRLGPCTFTEGDFNNFMLENDLVSGDNEPLYILDPDERQTLAQIYLDAVCSYKPSRIGRVSNSAIDEWYLRFPLEN